MPVGHERTSDLEGMDRVAAFIVSRCYMSNNAIDFLEKHGGKCIKNQRDASLFGLNKILFDK